MSALLGILPPVVHAAVSAAATVSPSPSITPEATPVLQAVHAVAHASSGNWLPDFLNQWASTISLVTVIAVAGTLAVFLQSLLNRMPVLKHDVAAVQDAVRFTVAVALPYIGTYLASVASGDNTTGAAPFIFLASQIAFYVWKFMKAWWLAQATAPAGDLPAAG